MTPLDQFIDYLHLTYPGLKISDNVREMFKGRENYAIRTAFRFGEKNIEENTYENAEHYYETNYTR